MHRNNPNYTRVIPRDLFNEAKLLKCLGQLALLAHDGDTNNLPLQVVHQNSISPEFVVAQRYADGGLYCVNVAVLCGAASVRVYTSYNSKSPYPLLFARPDGSEGDVFTDDGKLSTEFVAFCREHLWKGDRANGSAKI